MKGRQHDNSAFGIIGLMEVPELQFVVKQEEDGGYCASCTFPGNGLFTQGDTLEELHANIAEVTQLYLDDLADELGEQ